MCTAGPQRPDIIPEDMPDRVLDMSDRMPEDMPEHIAEDMPGRMPEDMPDRMPEDMLDKMPEDMSDRMPEDLPVTKRTSSTAQGGGGSFKNRKPIGELGCCE